MKQKKIPFIFNNEKDLDSATEKFQSEYPQLMYSIAGTTLFVEATNSIIFDLKVEEFIKSVGGMLRPQIGWNSIHKKDQFTLVFLFMFYFIIYLSSSIFLVIIFKAFCLSTITTCPQPKHLSLKSTPTLVISHNLLPQGCCFLVLTISPILYSILSLLLNWKRRKIYLLNLSTTVSLPKTCIISYKSGVFCLPVKVTRITVLISPTCPGHFSGSALNIFTSLA